MKKYSKAIAAAITSTVAVIAALVADGAVPASWGTISTAVVAAIVPILTAAGVYYAPANEGA